MLNEINESIEAYVDSQILEEVKHYVPSISIGSKCTELVAYVFTDPLNTRIHVDQKELKHITLAEMMDEAITAEEGDLEAIERLELFWIKLKKQVDERFNEAKLNSTY